MSLTKWGRKGQRQHAHKGVKTRMAHCAEMFPKSLSPKQVANPCHNSPSLKRPFAAQGQKPEQETRRANQTHNGDKFRHYAKILADTRKTKTRQEQPRHPQAFPHNNKTAPNPEKQRKQTNQREHHHIEGGEITLNFLKFAGSRNHGTMATLSLLPIYAGSVRRMGSSSSSSSSSPSWPFLLDLDLVVPEVVHEAPCGLGQDVLDLPVTAGMPWPPPSSL